MRICIAGVNQGLGLVLSRLMAEKGHTVYGCYRNKPSPAVEEIAKQFAGFRPIELDVTDEKAAEAASRKIAGDCGLETSSGRSGTAEGAPLDAVIVNAGILTDSDRELLITDASIDDLRAALETNVLGSAIMIKHFNKLVKDGGMFIVITSEGGSMTTIGTKYPGYSVSKSAQNKLAAIFSKTVTRYKVYALHPGRMNTVMGRNDAQIEPEEAALGIYEIVTGEKTIPPENGWFIDYHGNAMEI